MVYLYRLLHPFVRSSVLFAVECFAATAVAYIISTQKFEYFLCSFFSFAYFFRLAHHINWLLSSFSQFSYLFLLSAKRQHSKTEHHTLTQKCRRKNSRLFSFENDRKSRLTQALANFYIQVDNMKMRMHANIFICDKICARMWLTRFLCRCRRLITYFSVLSEYCSQIC